MKNDYLIIGNGRLALHLNHILKYHQKIVVNWSRNCGSDLNSLILESDKILLAVKDEAIDEIIETYKLST